jgi:RNA polymerase sigma-70 factor (ECF subfamily)
MSPSPDDNVAPLPLDPFPSTHWSVVLRAQDCASPQAEAALASLCSTYWYPLYAFIRRQVDGADQAQDLTQEFFALFLEKDFLGPVTRDKGRFRAYLLACCKHFLCNQHDRERAQKRGGGCRPLSLDFRNADDRYRQEPAHSLTAETLFERRWALTLLEQVLERLGQECHADGKAALYEALKVVLFGGPEAPSHAEVGASLGMTQAAVKKAAQRLRQRYRTLLRQQIADTVESSDQVDEEVRSLFAVLGS